MNKDKTIIEEFDRSIYDHINLDIADFKVASGLNEGVVREISLQKNEPEWMLDIRLKGLKLFYEIELPTWGPDISKLNLDEIVTYVKPKSGLKTSWDEVPADIKTSFDLLGIPQAERTSLAGVGAQYDSEVVYHSLKEDMSKLGVIYTDMATALVENEQMVKDYFMSLITPSDHKFAALHAAVWSGGSFVYIPKGVRLDVPLQSYFRFNSPGAGQFEHTMIIVDEGASLHFIEGCSAPKYDVVNLHAGAVELFVKDNASLKFSTIENWSKNMFNLNTKRATIGKNGSMEWVSGTFGSEVTMLYPMSILKGEGAHTSFLGVSFAAKGQNLDTGTKIVHAAPNTTSTVDTRSISRDGGVATYRSSVNILPNATGSKSSVSCESLMMDAKSRADTLPVMDIRTDDVDMGHEAKIGRISEEAVFYMMSRGLNELQAKELIVRGFVEPIAKELPLEYAVEMNNLISLELKGSIG